MKIDDIISYKEGNGNLLIKIRNDHECHILLYENTTKQELFDNIRFVGQRIAKNIKFQPVAKFRGDILGWEMGLKFIENQDNKLILDMFYEKIIEFKKCIEQKTNNFSKPMTFKEGALFIDLYENAILELEDYEKGGSIKDIFNNPDSQLRQAIMVYRTW